jgi:hypothetical protein
VEEVIFSALTLTLFFELAFFTVAMNDVLSHKRNIGFPGMPLPASAGPAGLRAGEADKVTEIRRAGGYFNSARRTPGDPAFRPL